MVFELLVSEMRSKKGPSTRVCLALLLTKLRTALSNGILSTLFAIEKHRIGRAVKTARVALMSLFVPCHLDIDHISPDSIITNHTTSMSKNLFANGENVCILVADGTNMFIQKFSASNCSFKRHTYSIHKERHPVKPMMLFTTTGYIVDILGSYFSDGKNNDASIFENVLRADLSKLRAWLPSNTIFVVDRSFRDCLGFLKDL